MMADLFDWDEGVAGSGEAAGGAMAQAVPEAWRPVLMPLLATPGGIALDRFLDGEERAGKAIYPPPAQRFTALALVPPQDVRVVILGQDPYHGPGQAHGLAFSVSRGVRVPPSLVNIHKELASDLGLPRPQHGNLERWARQGVLLLNSALSVEAARAGSHQKAGWAAITDGLVDAVALRPEPCVFMLWGAFAQGKAERVERLGQGRHLVLRAAHPSPLSARTGFFGCRHFSRANQFLESHGRGTIDWRVDD